MKQQLSVTYWLLLAALTIGVFAFQDDPPRALRWIGFICILFLIWSVITGVVAWFTHLAIDDEDDMDEDHFIEP